MKTYSIGSDVSFDVDFKNVENEDKNYYYQYFVNFSIVYNDNDIVDRLYDYTNGCIDKELKSAIKECILDNKETFLKLRKATNILYGEDANVVCKLSFTLYVDEETPLNCNYDNGVLINSLEKQIFDISEIMTEDTLHVENEVEKYINMFKTQCEIHLS